MNNGMSRQQSLPSPDAASRHSGKRPAWFTPIFFALSGTLMATSIVNVGNSGIAFFYLAFLFPFASLIFPPDWTRGRNFMASSVQMALLIGALTAALLATTVLQMVTLNFLEPRGELVHLISRLSFLGYFLIAHWYLHGETLAKTLVWLRRCLMVVCAYGVYQLPAKLLGLPLFLDWLRNNRSFDTYGYDTAGWIGLIRATSIYAEPSQATIPILVLFILNLQISTSALSKTVGWLVLIAFTIMTFSRTAWVAVGIEAVLWLLFRSERFARIIQVRRPTLIWATLLALLISPMWGFLEARDNVDLSAQERSGGIVLGVEMIRDAPILGQGWNSFSAAVSRYSNLGPSVDSSVNFGFIHNMVVSYVQQAGLSGLLLAVLPFILLIGWSSAPCWVTYASLASFLVTAELGDIGYSSLTWFWLAALVNMSNALPYLESRRISVRQPLYTGHMSPWPRSSS